MSVLTDVVVIVDHEPDAAVEQALTTTDFGNGQKLARISTDQAGGHKVFCGAIYAACFNYVAPESVREVLSAIDWGWSDPVAYIRHESDDQSSIWRPENDR